ncbi:DUF6210 family protein [Kitasatospora sp. NPDC057904]|uniref:DUF6210 family protein n=1 Tax=Kitasatospora sp. NPDC057904 TaxID=3346275 RepID=UPI0036D9C8F3
MRPDDTRLHEADEARIPVTTPDGPAILPWSNSDRPAPPRHRHRPLPGPGAAPPVGGRRGGSGHDPCPGRKSTRPTGHRPPIIGSVMPPRADAA